MAFGFFFSAAPTAQNSPELHFRFINSFIPSSLLRSLGGTLNLRKCKTFNFQMSFNPIKSWMCNWLSCELVPPTRLQNAFFSNFVNTYISYLLEINKFKNDERNESMKFPLRAEWSRLLKCASEKLCFLYLILWLIKNYCSDTSTKMSWIIHLKHCHYGT